MLWNSIYSIQQNSGKEWFLYTKLHPISQFSTKIGEIVAKILLFLTFPHDFLLIHKLSTCVFLLVFHIMWKLWIVQISLILSAILMWIIFPQCCGNHYFFHLSTIHTYPLWIFPKFSMWINV